LLQIFELK